MKPIEILKEIRKETKEIILFHSLSGKDSVMLLELCTSVFDHVHCYYMYYVAHLQHMARYRRFFEKQYNNITFYEKEHYAIASYVKTGHLGCEKDEKRPLNSLSNIMKEARSERGINWVVLGSKQQDGLSRRLQLKGYEHEAIDRKNYKVYPLSKLTNKKVLDFISENDLISPLNYGRKNQPSQSNDVVDPVFLKWCKDNHPGDYARIIEQFPECQFIIFRYEQNKKTERDS